MELALEEEWNGEREEILHDFSKLVDVKAYAKVLVCFPKEALRRDLPLELAKRVSAQVIKHPDEAYLLILFSRDARRKQSERIQVEGFALDYRGELTALGSRLFPDEPTPAL